MKNKIMAQSFKKKFYLIMKVNMFLFAAMQTILIQIQIIHAYKIIQVMINSFALQE